MYNTHSYIADETVAMETSDWCCVTTQWTKWVSYTTTAELRRVLECSRYVQGGAKVTEHFQKLITQNLLHEIRRGLRETINKSWTFVVLNFQPITPSCA